MEMSNYEREMLKIESLNNDESREAAYMNLVECYYDPDCEGF
jgi:hypothetical protein